MTGTHRWSPQGITLRDGQVELASGQPTGVPSRRLRKQNNKHTQKWVGDLRRLPKADVSADHRSASGGGRGRGVLGPRPRLQESGNKTGLIATNESNQHSQSRITEAGGGRTPAAKYPAPRKSCGRNNIQQTTNINRKFMC